MVRISDKTDYSRFVRPADEEPARVVCVDSPTRPMTGS
jgi:hypothetical protein